MQTSRLLEYICGSFDCKLLSSKVGEINVVEKMIENDSEIGGEGNCGGVIYRRVHPGRGQLTGMALILERLAMSPTVRCRRSSTATADVQPFGPLHGAARFPAREVLASLSRKCEKYQPLTFDGLRFDLEEGRILVRRRTPSRSCG